MKTHKNTLTFIAGLSLGWVFAFSDVNAQTMVLSNTDFESPTMGAWEGNSELWSGSVNYGGTVFEASVGSGAWDGGDQFAKIQGTNRDFDMLSQVFEISSYGTIDLSFIHRGVSSATEQDFVSVELWYYGLAAPTVLYSSDFGATNGAWSFHEDAGIFNVTSDLYLGFYELVFRSGDGSPLYENLVDNVSLTITPVTVPEPSGAVLALTGGLLFGLRRRRL